jgi:hypothetical protein
MAGTPAESFADIVALARARLTAVEVKEDTDAERGILTVHGCFDRYRILLKETRSLGRRRYAFYILLGERVMLGFDNHPDHHALRLKYGRDFAAHIYELIPHRHSSDKSSTELTAEWTAASFLDNLERLIAQIGS